MSRKIKEAPVVNSQQSVAKLEEESIGMYLGNIANLDQDRKILAPLLLKGLEYIQQTDFSRVEKGKHEIDGLQIFTLVQEQQTPPNVSRRLEAYLKFIDIQYVIEGTDVIVLGLPDAANEIEKNLSAKKDCVFFKNVRDVMDLVSTPGRYAIAIIFSGEVHRPNCQYRVSEKLRKVVVKGGWRTVGVGMNQES
jgi:biofilm protein TabA